MSRHFRRVMTQVPPATRLLPDFQRSPRICKVAGRCSAFPELMSVWLPRRPLALNHLYVRSLVANRHVHLLARRAIPAVNEQNFQQASTALVCATRRWQSSKETISSASADTRISADAKSSSVQASKDDQPKLSLSVRVWRKVRHEAAHYWSGTKLLVSEVRISSRLQWKILQGETLTRRERRQASLRNVWAK